MTTAEIRPSTGLAVAIEGWVARLGVAASLALGAWLFLVGQVQAATEGPAATGSGDTTLLIAALAGAALAAAWLLKPGRQARPPEEPSTSTASEAKTNEDHPPKD